MSATCHGCGRQWTGLAECHCSGCHEHFGSVSSFDAHHRVDGCIHPAELLTKTGEARLVAVIRASGPVWVAPGGEWRNA